MNCRLKRARDALHAEAAAKRGDEEDDPKMVAKRAEVIAEAEAMLLKLRKPAEPAGPPVPRTPDEENELANKIRLYIAQDIKKSVCACCSRRCRQRDVTSHPWLEIKEWLELLRCDVEPTEDMPRDALTQYVADEQGKRIDEEVMEDKTSRGVLLHGALPDGQTGVLRTVRGGHRFCLQAAAVLHQTGDEPVRVLICDSCEKALAKSRVPKESLVRIDTGAIPPHLSPLPLLEEALLALGRPLRYVSVMRPSGDRSCSQYCYRGHLIAFPNVDVASVRRTIPLPLSEIPSIMQVCASC